MISVLTEIAIDYMASISMKRECGLLGGLTSGQIHDMLHRLETGGLIRLCQGAERGLPSSYELTDNLSDITLLKLLTVLDEHLDCNHTASEYMYLRFGIAARKLGVLSEVIRTYLSNIKLTDL